jgi:opacity protein-like surface antigen
MNNISTEFSWIQIGLTYLTTWRNAIMSRLFCSLILAIFSLPTYAGEHILTPMLGISNWSDNTGHTARGSSLSFRDSNETTYGFRYLYQLDSRFAFGGNIYLYDMDVTTTSQANDAGVAHFHALAEYFFNNNDNITPFIGAGVGVSAIGFSGGNLDDDGTAGLSFELNGGVMFRLTDIIGLQLEYKLISFEMDEDIHSLRTNIDTTASSFLIGLNIQI